MLNVQFYSVCVIFSIHFLLNATQGIKTFFKSGFVMVAHDIIHFGVGDVSAKISQMIKSLSAFGVGRSLIFREKRCNLTADKGSVDHNIFCLSRVDIDAIDLKRSTCSIEVFIGNFALVVAVNGVGKSGFKIVKVK